MKEDRVSKSIYIGYVRLEDGQKYSVHTFIAAGHSIEIVKRQAEKEAWERAPKGHFNWKLVRVHAEEKSVQEIADIVQEAQK